jgi:phosphatidylserine/phosphatidylglycerophosphate/cardiolipin synthase-like enzyme/uncharacterized membrane protein YdjX (TVP38/TMEM64 family)
MHNNRRKQKAFSLKEGENCWRRSHIQQGGFILSGRDYFRAFRQALLQAEKYVYILAWDLSDSIELVRHDDFDDGHPLTLSEFIFSVLDETPELHVYILLWDYSLVYLAEREWLPFTKWREKNHPRLHLRADDAINVGASHHQKVVVVDDSVAFCGGFDLCAWRWDTKEHKTQDPRRNNPNDELYQPYHDVHVVLSGKAAEDLGDLCADRWHRATGEDLPRRKTSKDDTGWPARINRDFQNKQVGIALTYSAYKEYQAIYQIEQLYLDIIKSCQKYIYIENQYLSSHTIANALIERLKEQNGPEVIVVLTKEMDFFEDITVGLLRDKLLKDLVEADRYGRFFAYYPFVKDDSGNGAQIYVHAKLLITDDRIVIVGSANLSNRSMKVDSEVDLILYNEEPVDEVKNLIYRLFAIHFDCTAEEVKHSLDAEGSLHGMIQDIDNGCSHTLKRLEPGTGSAVLRKLTETGILDPDEPLSPASWMREDNGEGKEKDEAGKKKRKWSSFLKWGLVILAGVSLAWILSTLWGGVLDKESTVDFFTGFRNDRMVIPVLLGIFFIAGLIAVPINILLIASTVAIGPWITFGCGITGSLLSAVIAFAAGSRFGRPLLQKFAEKQLKSISRKVAGRGMFSVAAIRLVPIAPFVIVNLAAGFSNISFSSFFYGSILGMVPGMIGVVWVTHSARSAFTNPQWENWLVFGILLIAIGSAAYFIRRKIKLK